MSRRTRVSQTLANDIWAWESRKIHLVAACHTHMGCRGLWIEIVPLLSGSCTLPGTVNSGSNSSPKSLTC